MLHDEQMVLAAVEPVSEAGAQNKQTVLNILSRLIDSPPVPPLQTLHTQGEPRPTSAATAV
jgi:hypothetical protein